MPKINIHIEADCAAEARAVMKNLIGGVFTAAEIREKLAGNPDHPWLRPETEKIGKSVEVETAAPPADEEKTEEPKPQPKRRGRPAKAAKPEPAPEPEPEEEAEEPEDAEEATTDDEEEEAGDAAEDEEADDMIGGFAITAGGLKALMERYRDEKGMDELTKNAPQLLGARKLSEVTEDGIAPAMRRLLAAIDED